jgi:hypothetical protein
MFLEMHTRSDFLYSGGTPNSWRAALGCELGSWNGGRTVFFFR